MNGTAKLNSGAAKASNRIKETQMLHPQKWQRHGKNFIESINEGQAPRVLAVGPRVVGGLKARYLNKPGYGGVPGTVFEVTTMNDGTFDSVGAGSVFYAVKHLGVTTVDVWGNGNRTQAKTIESLKGFIYEPLELRKVSIFGDSATNVAEAEAVVVSCSDSRVQVHDIYSNVVVVSNAGNILSLAAIEVIEEMVGEGVPIVMVMGHTKCGAVNAAVAGNSEVQLAKIMKVVNHNLKEGGDGEAEVKNAVASADILKGDGFAEYYGERLWDLQGKIRNAKVEVITTFLDLADGAVKEI